jgi:Ring finger domain
VHKDPGASIHAAQVVDRSCCSHRCTGCLPTKKYVVPRDTIETSAECDRVSTRSSFRRAFSIRGLLGGVDHSLPMCAICLDIFDDGDTVCSSQNIQCLHQFHLECAFEWLLKSQECPCCRRDYLTAGDDNFDIEKGVARGIPIDNATSPVHVEDGGSSNAALDSRNLVGS